MVSIQCLISPICIFLSLRVIPNFAKGLAGIEVVKNKNAAFQKNLHETCDAVYELDMLSLT